MKFLLIQCYRGVSIGEIEIENINDERYFYYNFKREALKDKLEPNGNVFLVQFKDELVKSKDKNGKNIEFKVRKCCAMAFGEYEELKIDSVNSEKGLLKIKNIKAIKSKKDKSKKDKSEFEESEKYKNVIEIIKQINPKLLNNDVTHKLIEIEIDNDKFKGLKQLADDNEDEDEEITENIRASYNKLESNLCELAQKSIYAKRVQNKKGRKENRTEYQRDWERIIHSKAFRRLEDKAQIYTLAKGDHFRTRLTHTLEVAQIAGGIARELELNEDLVEAIALGHDLGHTPFGHVGERTLNTILKNEGVEGGFKHNFQGVKVVNYLEEKYGDFEGIDLTYQVMEGILKHTKISDCKKCSEYDEKNEECSYGDLDEALKCEKNSYKIEKFLCKGDVEKLHPEYKFSTTLEGQVVAVADEIAQRAHDLDDGIASGIINEEKFLENLKQNNIFKDLRVKIDGSLDYIDKDKRYYIDILDIKRARIVSDVITYFIDEIVKKSDSRIKKYKDEESKTTDLKEVVIRKPLISFHYDDSEDEFNIEEVRQELENITSNKIINSEEVYCFDGKGEYIINKLYNAYYNNPRQMPRNTLKRIFREISKHTNDVINISESNNNLVEKEIDIYKKKEKYCNEIEKIKHEIFVRCVVDLIAGMTDEFAKKQFEKLYSPRIY